ncbi:Triple Functional Domain Protein [Manis pentadactyla]|nr:Triple Functional Domain Protein [Manis pentadactyla]
MRKFTPRRASPESLGHPCKPRLPEGAGARPCPGVGPREPLEASPGIPCSPGPAEPRRVAARRRVPRLPHAPGLSAAATPMEGEVALAAPATRCPPPEPTGMGGGVGRPPGPGVWAPYRPRGPAVPKPRFRGASGRRGGLPPRPAAGEGAARKEAPAGSAEPYAHTPSRQPRPRAGILAAAGSHGAPEPLPKRAPNRREPLVGSERDAGTFLPVLVLCSRLGTRAPHPGTARSSTPPAPAGRAEPWRAGLAHVRGCLAAPRSSVAEAPQDGAPRALRPLAALCPALPGPRQERSSGLALGARAPASPRDGEPPPPLLRLANGSLGFQAAQPEERLGARARAHTHTHTHTRALHTGTHARGELELGRRSSFLSSPKKLPTRTAERRVKELEAELGEGGFSVPTPPPSRAAHLRPWPANL